MVGGVVTTWGVILKGHKIRKVENYCSRLSIHAIAELGFASLFMQMGYTKFFFLDFFPFYYLFFSLFLTLWPIDLGLWWASATLDFHPGNSFLHSTCSLAQINSWACWGMNHSVWQMFSVSVSVGVNHLQQWLSTFLMLRLFNTVPHVLAIPSHEIIFIAA